MPVNFPNSPSNDDEHSANGLIYKYNSTKGAWKRKFVAPTDATDINQLNDSSGLLTSSSTNVVADMAALIALTGMSSGDQAYVTANNKLYFYNGSGWYLIATVQNDAPSAITGVNGTYELAIDGTATTITAVSTDPEGFPLTWSYSTSGLGSIATVSNTDGVFTITPSTTEADAGTFSLTINATDGVNGAVSTSTNLTLEFIVTVTNSRYTTLLATAVDTSDNNNITDASTNNHSITVTGDAYAGTFSPYRSGGYSTRFLASLSNYVRAGSVPTLGNGAWTVECWVYFNDVPTSNKHIFGQNNWTGNGGHWAFFADYPKQIRFSYGSGAISVSNNVIADRTWHHICATRDTNGLITLYVDGASVGTAAGNANNFTYDNMMIGGNSNGQYSNVKIRDCRMVVGSVITPPIGGPTEPLTAVTNTVFLALHKPYISYDTNSTTDNVFTINGDIFTEPFSPYDYGEYSAADHGGSVYFVGGADYSSQYLSLSGPSMPSGDFTLSTWAYLTHTVADSKTLIDFNGNSGGFRINYMSNSNGGYHFRFYTAGGTVYLYDQNIDHHLNQWNYIVVVRDSGTFKLYVNNKLINTSTATPTFSSSTNVRIGQALGGFGTVEGYLSDIIYNPTTAITDFTPPTAPLSSSGAELHIKGTDASIIDKSQGTNLKLVGNTTGSTDEVRTGNWANTKTMKFDGNSDYLTFPHRKELNFASNDWTIECWIYPKTNVGDCGIWHQSASGTDWNSIYLDGSFNPKFVFYNSSNNVEWAGTAASNTAPQNTWTHLALVRKFGTGVYLFAGGTLVASDTNDTSVTMLDKTYDHVIGYERFVGSGTYFDGYIQDFRITNGLARYIDAQNPTANFTPPTASLEG